MGVDVVDTVDGAQVGMVMCGERSQGLQVVAHDFGGDILDQGLLQQAGDMTSCSSRPKRKNARTQAKPPSPAFFTRMQNAIARDGGATAGYARCLGVRAAHQRAASQGIFIWCAITQGAER